MVSDSAEPQTGQALKPSCWSVSKTSAMKARRHRINRYTSIRPAKADVDAGVDTATTARYAWEHVKHCERRYPARSVIHLAGVIFRRRLNHAAALPAISATGQPE